MQCRFSSSIFLVTDWIPKPRLFSYKLVRKNDWIRRDLSPSLGKQQHSQEHHPSLWDTVYHYCDIVHKGRPQATFSFLLSTACDFEVVLSLMTSCLHCQTSVILPKSLLRFYEKLNWSFPVLNKLVQSWSIFIHHKMNAPCLRGLFLAPPI